MVTHQPKKKFSQNFLTDEQIIAQIIYAINPGSQDHLVEIGPGLGAMTVPLLPFVSKIDAIELDRDIIPTLDKNTQHIGNIVIHQQDALTLALNQLTTTEKSLRIVGNLPYHISTPLIFHLLNQQSYIIDMHFMLQKEVAERIVSLPGSKIYGRLSVMTQYHCDAELLIEVPPTAFYPQPKVDSSVIRLIPKTPALLAKNPLNLEKVVKEAFTTRRKTLANALKKLVSREQLLTLGIDPMLRAEQLSVDNFVQISNIL